MEAATIDLDGPVHYVEDDGPADGPTFVCVHALAGHHGTWVALAPLLAARGRVLIPDLPGFGLSPLAGRRATLSAHRSTLDRFIRATADGPVVLVGNSMGGATSLLQAAAAPGTVAGLVMVAPAIAALRMYVVDPMILGIFAASVAAPTRVLQAAAARRADLTPERFVDEMIRVCVVDPARVPREVVEACVAVASARLTGLSENVRAFAQAARSVTRFVLRPRRYLRYAASVVAPTLLLLGAEDRLVPRALAEPVMRARPDWSLRVLPGVSHMPQIEDPGALARRIDRWLDGPRLRLVAG